MRESLVVIGFLVASSKLQRSNRDIRGWGIEIVGVTNRSIINHSWVHGDRRAWSRGGATTSALLLCVRFLLDRDLRGRYAGRIRVAVKHVVRVVLFVVGCERIGAACLFRRVVRRSWWATRRMADARFVEARLRRGKLTFVRYALWY